MCAMSVSALEKAQKYEVSYLANERKKISAASSTDKNIKQSPSRLSR